VHPSDPRSFAWQAARAQEQLQRSNDHYAWQQARAAGAAVPPPSAEIGTINAVTHDVVIPKGPMPTPGRCAHLARLVREGILTADDAQRLAPEGRVSDAAWRVIADLGSGKRVP
jgi:hypothetical protein